MKQAKREAIILALGNGDFSATSVTSSYGRMPPYLLFRLVSVGTIDKRFTGSCWWTLDGERNVTRTKTKAFIRLESLLLLVGVIQGKIDGCCIQRFDNNKIEQNKPNCKLLFASMTLSSTRSEHQLCYCYGSCKCNTCYDGEFIQG